MNNNRDISIDDILKKLWSLSRFTSYFYQSVTFRETPDIPTLCLVNMQQGQMLIYNQKFLNEMGMDYFTGLLVHEMLHILFQHNHRAYPENNPDLQNLAQDMVINSYITKKRYSFFSRRRSYRVDKHDREVHGISTPQLLIPPSLPLIPQKFHDTTGIKDPLWEEVYFWLIKETAENKSIENMPDVNVEKEQSFNDLDSPYGPDVLNDMISFKEDDSYLPTGLHMQSDVTKEKNEAVKNRLFFLADRDSLCVEEQIFQDLTAFIEKTREVDTHSWKREIISIVDYESQSHEWTYRSSRFNRRYFAQGIYSPGRMFREEEIVTVAVDVSASMTIEPEILEAAFGVIESLMRSYRIYLICLDEEVYIPRKSGYSFVPSGSRAPYRYSKGDWKYITSGAGGTTFFAPLFNDFMKGHREMLIIITDGEIFDIHQLKPYRPTLWVLPEQNNKSFKAPFGRTVIMKTGKKQ